MPHLPLQYKLAIADSSSPLEADADRVADRVIGMSAPSPQIAASGAAPAVRRKCGCEGSGNECSECQKKKEEKLQLKAQLPVTPVEAPPIVHNVLRSPGQALDAETRAFMEPRLGVDLGGVRIHTDRQAAASAGAVNALAYTSGRHIVFGESQYQPSATGGRRLLAHELAHVAQQEGGVTQAIQRQPGGAKCGAVRIVLPNRIVFEGNQGALSAVVKTSLAPSTTPYSIQYNPGEGQFVITPGENKILLEVSLEARPQSDINLYIAYRDSLAGKPVQMEVFAAGSSATVLQGDAMDPRHARGYAGEQSMGFGYRQSEGWIFVEGPSGSAGHGVTTFGFDGVAYNIKADELHLLDNKSLKSFGNVGSATAISKNLLKNLDTLIEKVEGMQDMPSRIRILQLLRQTRTALQGKTPIPKNVKLVVTSEGGQSTGVSESLEKQGVEFREPGTLTPQPKAPPGNASGESGGTAAPEGQTAAPEGQTTVPDTATPGGKTASPTGETAAPTGETTIPETGGEHPAGGGEGGGMMGGLFGFALPLIAGLIHQKAVEKRVEEQTHKEGYVPKDAPSGNGILYDLGAWLVDPFRSAENSIPMEKRLDFPVWRQKTRDLANAKNPGDTLTARWDVGTCKTDIFGNRIVDSREVLYKKQPDGKWVVVSGNTSGVPDLNDIVDPSVPDDKIKAYIYVDPCMA
jgi:hypothetical protein